MQTIEYIKQHGVQALKDNFGIEIRQNNAGLIVLNYSQIESPKANEIVRECRGLIIDQNFNVVSRTFDRFFNYGEQPDTQSHIDLHHAEIMDKIDGSLVRVYHWNGGWHVGTRGTAFGESQVGGFDLTFRDMIGRAIDLSALNGLPDEMADYTHICEVTGVENRVVTRYSGYTLWYFTSRNNKTGEYRDFSEQMVAIGAKLPKTHRFSAIEECIKTAAELPELQEGYVLYQDGIPVCKIKSPAYCAVHLIRGDGLTPNRIANLVMTGETDEYLTYFPEDTPVIFPYKNVYNMILQSAEAVFANISTIENQKEFALAANNSEFPSLLFRMRSGKMSALEAFNALTENARRTLIINASRV